MRPFASKSSIRPSTSLYGGLGRRYSEVLQYLRNNQPKFRPPPTEESAQDIAVIESIVKAADDRKAVDVVVFDLKGVADYADYFIIMEGNSKPQNQAILSTIEKDLKDRHSLVGSIQGEAASGWILIDYGSIIVNILLPKMRQFYKLEKKWKDGHRMDITAWLSGPSGEGRGVEYGSTEELMQDESKDPFWNDF